MNMNVNRVDRLLRRAERLKGSERFIVKFSDGTSRTLDAGGVIDLINEGADITAVSHEGGSALTGSGLLLELFQGLITKENTGGN